VFKNFLKKPSADNYQTNDLDKELLKALSKNRLPGFKQLKYIKKFLNGQEKIILAAAGLVLVLSLSFLWYRFYSSNLESKPDYGGEYTEGMVGAPQYINPLHAPLNSVDSAIAKLVYSSLFTRDNDGNLINDLAEKTDISADGKTYTIKITDKAKWQTDEKLTADDVVFTFNTLKDPQFKSPLRLSFQGVEIEKVDDYTVNFKLSQSYAPFKELLTFGIMPKNLWQDVSPFAFALAELNLRPIGSGPYQFQSLVKDKNGNIKNYTLVANNNYYGGRPHLAKIICRFFPEQTEAIGALNNGKLDGLSYLSWTEKDQITTANSFYFHELNLPEYSALFFNLGQEDERLSKLKFRQALAMITDRQKTLSEVYGSGPEIINGPILPQNSLYTPQAKAAPYNPNEALKIMEELGWKKGEADGDGKVWLRKNNIALALTITLPDNDELMAVAESIKKQWEDFGIKTELEIINKNELSSGILKSRSYSILLYNIAVSHDPDPYPVWHSSQVAANGFNLSSYKNPKTDKLLTDARAEMDSTKRQVMYKEFENLLVADQPAIWLFSQPYLYPQNKQVKGFDLKTVASPEERFDGVVNWHLKEKKTLKLK
jgi:peptide/nickel transport system substrate-binding protein